MKKCLSVFAFLIPCFFTTASFARLPFADTDSVKHTRPPVRKFYMGTGADAGIFSTAMIQKPNTMAGIPSPGTTNSMGTLRFSYVINFGITFNFNFGRHFGLYTGLDVKNIGFIEKNSGGLTVKRRTYNVGAPLGIKIGNINLRKRRRLLAFLPRRDTRSIDKFTRAANF